MHGGQDKVLRGQEGATLPHVHTARVDTIQDDIAMGHYLSFVEQTFYKYQINLWNNSV